MAASSIIYIQYANINLDALRLTGLKHDEYTYCYIAEQYQKISGWVECGVGNNFKSQYALKKYIAERAAMDERKMNRLMLKLRTAGYIEESPDKVKFRITQKFFVLHNPAPKGEAERQERMDAAVTAQQTQARAPKIPFSESVFNNDFDRFKTDLTKTKNLPSDTDWRFYYDKIKHYYTIEHPEKMYADWLQRCRDWLDKDRHKAALRRVSGAGLGMSEKVQAKTDTRNPQTDEALQAEVALFEQKVQEPETENYTEYRETAETYVAVAEKAEKRSLLSEEQKKDLAEMKHRLKTPGALRPYQVQQLRLLAEGKISPPDDNSS